MFDEINSWHQSRLGKITGSELHKLMVSGKAKGEMFGTAAITYINEKISELITGQQAKEIIGLNALEWGNAHEFEAIQLFEKQQQVDVTHYGGENPKFFEYNSFSGCSPDGETLTHILEVKCPYNSGIHTENLLASLKRESNDWMKKNRKDYYVQMHMEMLCLKKRMGYFISYDPRPLEERHRLAIIEIKMDIELCNEIDERITAAGIKISEAIELLDRKEPSVILAELDSETNTAIVS